MLVRRRWPWAPTYLVDCVSCWGKAHLCSGSASAEILKLCQVSQSSHEVVSFTSLTQCFKSDSNVSVFSFLHDLWEPSVVFRTEQIWPTRAHCEQIWPTRAHSEIGIHPIKTIYHVSRGRCVAVTPALNL